MFGRCDEVDCHEPCPQREFAALKYGSAFQRCPESALLALVAFLVGLPVMLLASAFLACDALCVTDALEVFAAVLLRVERVDEFYQFHAPFVFEYSANIGCIFGILKRKWMKYCSLS